MAKIKKCDKMLEMFSNENIIGNIISATKGKFFRVVFYTKSGDIRVKTVRTGVKKGLVGGLNTTAHLNNYLKLFVVSEKKWNNVDINNIIGIKCGDVVWGEV